MSIHDQRGPYHTINELSRTSPELEEYEHIEGLCGEETALLDVPAEERKQEQHERLHAISNELDRIWEKLRDRADSVRPGGSS